MTAFSFAKPDSFTSKHRKIGSVAFANAQRLDISGSFEIFSFANYSWQRLGICEQNVYTIKILADAPGPIKACPACKSSPTKHTAIPAAGSTPR